MKESSFTFNQQQKISWTGRDDQQLVEIGDTAINSGLLKLFPGSSLAIFLYILTHLKNNLSLQTNPTIISSYLPVSYDIPTIEKDLKYLEERGIIDIYSLREGDYTYKITFNPEVINQLLDQSVTEQTVKENLSSSRRREICQRLAETPSPSSEDIREALLSLVSSQQNLELVEDQIDSWLQQFDKQVLKELVRRVNKWLISYNYTIEQAFNYLRGIIDDWYSKEIFTYERLQHFDQLYREAREMAAVYGIKSWQNVTPTHMETFSKWLTADFPLSKTVACFAIREAIKRKKGSRPSLQYIEDNFINPWKKAEVRTIEQARRLLHKKSGPKQNQVLSSDEPRENWDDINWDFEDTGKL